jgi:hypothetical protein
MKQTNLYSVIFKRDECDYRWNFVTPKHFRPIYTLDDITHGITMT